MRDSTLLPAANQKRCYQTTVRYRLTTPRTARKTRLWTNSTPILRSHRASLRQIPGRTLPAKICVDMVPLPRTVREARRRQHRFAVVVLTPHRARLLVEGL